MITKILDEDEFQEKYLRKKLAKKRQFIEKASANPWTHFATLTFSPEIAKEAAYSYSKAKEAFMSWRKSIIRKYGSKAYLSSKGLNKPKKEYLKHSEHSNLITSHDLKIIEEPPPALN